MKKTFLFALMIGVFGFTTNGFAQTIDELIKKADAAMQALKTCTYDFHSQERFKGGKITVSHIQFKIQELPEKKIYANALTPTKAQLIYIPKTSSEVKVKKGLKLSLKLTAGLLMADQHQTIDRAGFDRIRAVLMTSINSRKGQDLNKFAKILGTVTFDGKECWKIEILDPDYKIIEHTVAAGETTIWKIGEKFAVPEYRIRELNNFDIDNDEVLTAGQKIKMPSSYAKKTTMYVEKATYLPLYQKMEDDLGMYETYELKNLKVNVPLTDADFQF